MPATEPTGSMAMAPKLDTDKLKHAIVDGLQHDESPQRLEPERGEHDVQAPRRR